MLKCRIYRCPTKESWICCSECAELRCPNRCLNHPDRCKCVNDGQQARKRPPVQHYDHTEILALARAGLTNKQIAAELGCVKSTVVVALSKAGFKRPARKGGADNGQ